MVVAAAPLSGSASPSNPPGTSMAACKLSTVTEATVSFSPNTTRTMASTARSAREPSLVPEALSTAMAVASVMVKVSVSSPAMKPGVPPAGGCCPAPPGASPSAGASLPGASPSAGVSLSGISGGCPSVGAWSPGISGGCPPPPDAASASFPSRMVICEPSICVTCPMAVVPLTDVSSAIPAMAVSTSSAASRRAINLRAIACRTSFSEAGFIVAEGFEPVVNRKRRYTGRPGEFSRRGDEKMAAEAVCPRFARPEGRFAPAALRPGEGLRIFFQ